MKQEGKPKGYFDRLLVIDCETTGICWGYESPVYNPSTKERHQAVSWGVIVADAHTLMPIEKLYIEVKWNEHSKRQARNTLTFGQEATKIHGLTRGYLEENGVDEEHAVELIGELILKYWGPDVTVKTLGHNVHLFDVAFLRDLFERHDIHIKFGSRHVDSSSVGFVVLGAWSSDDLFAKLGFTERGKHNALQDAEMTLAAMRIIRTLTKDIF